MLSPTPLGHIKGCFLKKLIKSKVEYPNENINTYCLLLSKPGISISKSNFFLEKYQQRQTERNFSPLGEDADAVWVTTAQWRSLQNESDSQIYFVRFVL